MTPTGTAVDPVAIQTRVREVLGSEAGMLRDGAVVASPTSDDEISALLRVANESAWRVLPSGAGTGRDIRPVHASRGREEGPGATSGPDLMISTLGMTELLDHEPADLTFRSRAGLALADLQAGVSGAGQWLALDPPGGGRVTLGGIVASGAAGPLRVQYGRPRDQLLGLTMIDGAGRILSLGGRVVKNVAGFDLVRLATGSRGALGIVTEVTFRLYPRPEADRTLVWSRESLEEAWDVGRSLAVLPLPLASAELIAGTWGAPHDDVGVRIALRMTGSEASVTRMRDVLLQQMGLPLRDLDGADSELAAYTLSQGDGEGPVSFRLQSLPDRGRPLMRPLSQLPTKRLAIHLLQGAIRGTIMPEHGVEVLEPLSKEASALGASLRVLRAPGSVPAGIESTSPSTVSQRLHAAICRGFDPGGVLPGAWLEGWK